MKFKQPKRLNRAVSALGYGCWGISGGDSWTGGSDKNAIQAIHAAIAGGINFFDVAPVYGLGHAETILGKALQGKARQDLIIASKCGLVWDKNNNVSNDLSAASLLKEIDDSLTRIGTDYLDIYQIHWPSADQPLPQTLETLQAIQASGKVRHLGVSNFSLAELEQADTLAPICSYQGLYNMLERNPEYYHFIALSYRTEQQILPYCTQQGLAFFPYSPLMQGLLSGHFDVDAPLHENDVRRHNPKLQGELLPKYMQIINVLQEFAGALGKPLNELAINWLADQPAVTSVIAGALNAEQVEANLNAMTWELTDYDRQALEQLLSPYQQEGLL
ncbi:aldo/keto reductase [Corallincola luteus]|uniref:Aldo/keto reductase n=2 Tax=Corallincola TaxID=1775176 RepID=A0A368NLN9_9GAMM|nr:MULTISPECIES: aldo/keto reductase [Corallincola]RCU51020.1 aldo/keto reductase [Corallincola holothuriorum]TCI04080.1 aldo/keto reductase [Corallincola luteus]